MTLISEPTETPISEEMQGHYWKHGYVVAPGLLEQADLDPWLERLDAIVNGRVPPAEGMLVMRDVMHQIREGNRSVVGVMIESFIEAGTQPIPADLTQLRYGCSVTDACVSWETTEEMLLGAHDMLRGSLPKLRAA